MVYQTRVEGKDIELFVNTVFNFRLDLYSDWRHLLKKDPDWVTLSYEDNGRSATVYMWLYKHPTWTILPNTEFVKLLLRRAEER